jgi:hypothetical protein
MSKVGKHGVGLSSNHGQYMCKCGARLAGCRCPDHAKLVIKVYDGCGYCQPGNTQTRQSIKDQLKVREK